MEPHATARILVVEDDAALTEVLSEALRSRGHMTVAAESVGAGIEQLRQSDFDLALVELALPDGSGIDVLRHIAEEGLPTEVVVLAGEAAVPAAIEAMNLGAYDYLRKPPRIEEIEVLVLRAVERLRLRRENLSLRVRLERQEPIQDLITEDPAMREILAALERVAPAEIPILIQGESGTGKELVARAVHRKSPRASQPFVALSCSAVPESLLEGELFGHERGAFTGALSRKPGLFEAAEPGVIFLDGVDKVPPAVQVQLLRVLETREFFRVGGTRPVHADVRLVSATDKNLKAEMQAGHFREDLYYRLNGVTLKLPPLRERRDDVPLLAAHFLERFSGRERSFTPAALEALRGYSWPGNVKELQMVVRRAAILSGKEVVDAAELPLDLGEPSWKVAALRSGLSLAEMQKEYILTVLQENRGHRGKTARALGIDPKTLYNKLGPERPRRKARAAD